MGRLSPVARCALLAGAACCLFAPGVGHAAELPVTTVPTIEVVVDTDGGLIDLGLFDGLVPPPVSDVVDEVGSAIDGTTGGVIGEDPLPGVPGAEGPGTGGPPEAEPTAATTTTRPAGPAGAGTTTTTREPGVVEGKGTGDSGYDESVGQGKHAAQSPAPTGKGSAAAPKPAAGKKSSRFALSGADVGLLATTGAALTGVGLIFRSAKWRRRGRAGRSS